MQLLRIPTSLCPTTTWPRKEVPVHDLIRSCQGSQILAVLCNPPLKQAPLTTSWRNLQTLGTVLGAAELNISNLIEESSRSSEDLAHLSGTIDMDQLSLRIRSAAATADVAVAAWGIHPPAGWKARHWADLINSALSGLADSGHSGVVHVGPSTRHPSRWRQYTSPLHERFVGSTFEDRLLESLQWSPTDALVPRHATYGR